MTTMSVQAAPSIGGASQPGAAVIGWVSQRRRPVAARREQQMHRQQYAARRTD